MEDKYKEWKISIRNGWTISERIKEKNEMKEK